MRGGRTVVQRRAAAPARGARVPLRRYLFSGDAATMMTAPMVYALTIPFLLLDASVSLYQAICFRAWGIRRVRRRDYFSVDRHRLPYLNALERANCVYCGYVNGLLAYAAEIAARTEQYWCPIQHGRPVRGAHRRVAAFAPYGDAEAYHLRLPFFRAALKRYTDR